MALEPAPIKEVPHSPVPWYVPLPPQCRPLGEGGLVFPQCANRRHSSVSLRLALVDGCVIIVFRLAMVNVLLLM